MPEFRHGDATIHPEEFGEGFPILTFAPAGLQSTIANSELIAEWKTGAALTSARARVMEFLSKHTPRA